MAATAAALGVVAVAPAVAGAVTVTVTGDSDQPVPLSAAGPVAIRNLDVEVRTVIGASEGPNFKTSVFDAAGTPANSPTCITFTNDDSESVTYRGNGTYRVVVQYFAESDSTCTRPTRTLQYLYTVNAGVGLAAPPPAWLTRQPNTFDTNELRLPFVGNPGASYEVRYALGGVIGPDGAISGPSDPAYVDGTTGSVPLRFSEPGSYTVVARGYSGDYYTPWSPPVVVRAIAPFDFDRDVNFLDSRGPSYRLKGYVREETARGRVTIKAARRSGKRYTKYRTLGRPRIRSNGTFTLRFKLRKTGRYKVRYSFKGSSTTAAGRVDTRIRIARRVFF